EKQNKLFSKAKMAVRHHEYRCITYHYHEEEILENIKCLKLVFMSNNWYLAIEDSAQTLRFLRFCFIKAINYSKKNNSFQRCVLDRYVHFFHRLQNPMTLNIDPQTAYLRASKHIAVYFRTSMKPFFPSQKFLRHNDDGSIDFSLAFTQNIEILPFIKQWQPHLVVLSPDALKEELLNDMRQSLDNH
ncbi:MAG: WYL domain-containing protein, partial [Sulfurimonas sp.]